jgi:hypothetical protein
MPSDQQRLDQVLRHIRRIKTSDYAVIVGSAAEASGSKEKDRGMER